MLVTCSQIGQSCILCKLPNLHFSPNIGVSQKHHTGEFGGICRYIDMVSNAHIHMHQMSNKHIVSTLNQCQSIPLQIANQTMCHPEIPRFLPFKNPTEWFILPRSCLNQNGVRWGGPIIHMKGFFGKEGPAKVATKKIFFPSKHRKYTILHETFPQPR